MNLNLFFFNCSSLISLPDISKWNFFNSELEYYNRLIDYIISMADVIEINKVLKQLSFINSNYDNQFLGNCGIKSPQSNIKNIEVFKTIFNNEAYIMKGLFAGCSSLKYLPDISKWNIGKAQNIRSMFLGCTSLIELPDIS